MIFFFPIEIKIRELLGKVFLAYQLVKKNNEVIIGGQRDIPVNISKIKNCFWFDKNTYYKKINLKTNMIYKDKNIIGMFDEEGPVSFFPKLTSETRYPKQLIKYFNIFYYWGKNDLGNGLQINNTKFNRVIL